VSATLVVMIVGAVLLALAWLFLVAVLRSHAEILRRLSKLESRLDPAGFALGEADGPEPERRDVPEVRAFGGDDAPDIVGETQAGDAVKLAFGPGAPRTLLAFLSTGCSVCGPLWDELRAGGPVVAGVRVVVVTKGSDRESLTRLGRLAPGECELVMSTAAWNEYSVAATPHFVLVDEETRRILGRGGATSWAQIISLLTDAESDESLHRARGTSERAARAEQALAASGISPGHHSLYPSAPKEALDE
jgi:hypothetical protein